MKKYVIAICSAFDNENKLFKVEAENELEALKQALLDYTKPEYKEDQVNWNKTIGGTVEEIRTECFNSDMMVSIPIEI